MTARVELRQRANKPECDSCEYAIDERRELARQVDEGTLTLDEAVDRYLTVISSCGGLISTVVRVTETEEGKRRLDVVEQWRNDPLMSQFADLAERFTRQATDILTLCTNTDRVNPND